LNLKSFSDNPFLKVETVGASAVVSVTSEVSLELLFVAVEHPDSIVTQREKTTKSASVFFIILFLHKTGLLTSYIQLCIFAYE
jgi:hypothetical protein